MDVFVNHPVNPVIGGKNPNPPAGPKRAKTAENVKFRPILSKNGQKRAHFEPPLSTAEACGL